MTLYLLSSQNMMINSDHIIRANFYPAHMIEAHKDVDGNDLFLPASEIKAHLELFLTERVSEELSDFCGDFRGVTSISNSIHLYSSDAELLWSALERSCYPILDFSPANKDQHVEQTTLSPA
jgi:hypothetical protein